MDCWAQTIGEGLVPDEAVITGFVYRGKEEVTATVAGSNGTQVTYNGGIKYWANSSSPYSKLRPATLTITCFLTANRRDAAEVMSAQLRQRQSPATIAETEAGRLGDTYYIASDGTSVSWIQGNVVVLVDLAIVEFELRKTIGKQLVEDVVRDLETKAETLNSETSLPIFEVEGIVSENPSTQGKVTLSVLLSDGAPEPAWRFSAYDIQDKLSFRSGLLKGDSDFVWELDSFPSGHYTLVFNAFDSLQRFSAMELDFVVSPRADSSSLSALRDSTIRAQKPHRNEGANPRLFLSHRLEARNKSLNPIVAFDLANTNLSGLTRATLVMNIQDCDLPRRWGNEGRSIEAHPMTQSWTEGNGNKYRQRGQEGRTKGEGTGVTWFSPADTQIRNNRPNGSSQWSGARMSLGPITAPAVVVTNGQTGPIEFDVTQDVLNGYYEGWLLKKQDEAKFGNIRFFSKEAGDAEIAPKLLLEFSGPIAKASSSNSLLGTFTSFGSKLRPSSSGSELKTLREVLKESPTAARIGEQLLQTASHVNPALGFASTTVYRVWLS